MWVYGWVMGHIQTVLQYSAMLKYYLLKQKDFCLNSDLRNKNSATHDREECVFWGAHTFTHETWYNLLCGTQGLGVY